MSDNYERLKAQKNAIVARQRERSGAPQSGEREMLIYWLLRCYQSAHREGWEDGPSTDETMDGLCSVLANIGYDPNLSEAAKELVQRKPVYAAQQSSGEVLVSKSAIEDVEKLVDEWGAMAEQFWKEGDRGNAATRQGWICGARATLKALGLTEVDG